MGATIVRIQLTAFHAILATFIVIIYVLNNVLRLYLTITEVLVLVDALMEHS